MAITVEEASRHPGERVAAWDAGAVGHEWLGIYAASDAGVKLLAFERTDRAGRLRRIAALEPRGVRIGKTYGGEYVWAIVDGRNLVAWNLDARLFAANRSTVQVGASVFPAANITRVTSWVDPVDLGHRGISVERAGEPPVVLVEERDPASALDPTYNRDNLALDAAWASSLGRDLALWLGVDHADLLP
ncbi:hypothetical protein [Pyxidicoccus xibeiensis]|uniref:hypothetical protein n=1 Tax=Pyxidicoccus xibeiensis TaxID=2906759 RepID=UPI0020A7F2EB|nr:hypothetical protein [Pyxidicoccus xibeiensis]MCP3138059.1 hypothetical protein [Pyxidicoccus xibeiensis]